MDDAKLLTVEECESLRKNMDADTSWRPPQYLARSLLRMARAMAVLHERAESAGAAHVGAMWAAGVTRPHWEALFGDDVSCIAKADHPVEAIESAERAEKEGAR
jgi:hypothetical protein